MRYVLHLLREICREWGRRAALKPAARVACCSILSIASLPLAASQLPGRYELTGVMETASQLVLKPDGTFEYVFVYGAADYQAKGSWRQEGAFLILNTSGTAAPPFRLARSALTSQGEATRIWVKAANGRGVEHIDVAVRTSAGENRQRTGADGSALFPGTGASTVTLHVPVYEVQAGPFQLNPAHNDFSFEINGEAITQVRFKDERLRINDRDLEMRFWSKDRAMRYVRK